MDPRWLRLDQAVAEIEARGIDDPKAEIVSALQDGRLRQVRLPGGLPGKQEWHRAIARPNLNFTDSTIAVPFPMGAWGRELSGRSSEWVLIQISADDLKRLWPSTMSYPTSKTGPQPRKSERAKEKMRQMIRDGQGSRLVTMK